MTFSSREQGNKGQILSGTGNKGTATIVGTGNIRKRIFDFGTRGTCQFISGSKENTKKSILLRVSGEQGNR